MQDDYRDLDLFKFFSDLINFSMSHKKYIPPIKVHKMNSNQKSRVPGVKIVINSLHIKPNIEM